MHQRVKTIELPDAEIKKALGESHSFDGINPNKWSIEGPIIQARRSYIYKAFHPDIETPLSIKYSKKGERSEKSISQEFKNLKKFHSAMQSGTDYGIPRPYASMPESGILVMEWIDGTSLKESLNKRFLSRKTRDNLLSRSAIWLREFHQSGDMTVEAFDPASLPIQIENYIKNSGIIDSPCKTSVLEAGQLLQSHVNSLQSSEENICLKHGDFTPGNILHTPIKMYGIDMTLNKRAPIFEDISRFIIELYVNDRFLVTFARYYFAISKTKSQSDEKCFLSAYFGKEYEKQKKMVFLYLLLHGIKKLVQAARIVSTHRQERGYKSPILFAYRYIRFWKRKMIVLQLQKALSEL